MLDLTFLKIDWIYGDKEPKCIFYVNFKEVVLFIGNLIFIHIYFMTKCLSVFEQNVTINFTALGDRAKGWLFLPDKSVLFLDFLLFERGLLS